MLLSFVLFFMLWRLTSFTPSGFLTPMEYKILALFMKNPGMIFTKVQIYENTCGEYVESDDNTIMVHISNLREKIEENPKNPQYIKTIRGVGYKIENR